MKLLVYTKYGAKGASSRYRILQYLPYLQARGWQVKVDSLVPDAHLDKLYKDGVRSTGELVRASVSRLWRMHRRSAHDADVCLVQYEFLPYAPFVLEAAAYRRIPTVVDYDDATYATYAGLPFLNNKIGSVMRRAGRVIVGNQHLYEYAQRYNSAVDIIPTVIDLKKYLPKDAYRYHERLPVIGWIGTPVTQAHLMTAASALSDLARVFPFVLRCVGVSPDFMMPGVTCERIPWSEESEGDVIRTFDIGIMPLPMESTFAAGKCGFKLIQYMACGVPVLGSALGANNNIVEPGENGFLAKNQGEFYSNLLGLLSKEDLRTRLGRNARSTVERRYTLDCTAPLVGEVLRRASPSSQA